MVNTYGMNTEARGFKRSASCIQPALACMLHRELTCVLVSQLSDLTMAVCSIDRSLQRAMPDRDPDAPDAAPLGPLLSSACWILFNSTSVFHRLALGLPLVLLVIVLSNITSVYYRLPSLVLLRVVHLVTSHWVTSHNHQLPSLVLLLVVNLVPVLLVTSHWDLSDSTSVYRQPPSLLLLFVVLLVTSCWFFRARQSQCRQLTVPAGRCRIPDWMFAVLHTCVTITESILLYSSVLRATRHFLSWKLRGELRCRIPAVLTGICVFIYVSMCLYVLLSYAVRALRKVLQSQSQELEPSNRVHRLCELITFCKRSSCSIDQSLIVRRVFRIIQCPIRMLTVLVPLRMRELACKFLDSWMLQADNYVQRLREEVSCSQRTRISIDHYVVLRSLSSWSSQETNEARRMMSLWIEEKSLLCSEGVLTMCNAFMVVIRTLSNDEDEGRKNEDTTMQQTSSIFILNEEQRDAIFARLDLNEISRLQMVCKAFMNLKQSSTLRSLRNTREGLFGPSIFFLESTTTGMSWEWISYNIISQQWKRMPSFSSLPLPDQDLFKDYLIAGSNGLMCLDVGKGDHEALVVYQPLTRAKKILPPLIHRRRPVLIAIVYDDCKKTYKIIVAGSSTTGTEHLSRKTEVYDSCTSCWKESDDVPGPEFALNEYQTGVYAKNADTLFCTGFLPQNKGRGILAYNVGKEVWIKNVVFHLPYNFDPSDAGFEVQITNAQLIEYKNRVFLFSEQELGQEVTHSIHELSKVQDCEIMSEDGDGLDMASYKWKRLLSESRNGARGLLVYPEFECQVHGDNQFCIFNTIERSGVLYTVHIDSGMPITIKQKLPPCPKLKKNSLTFHSLNSLNFVFELSFKVSL